jgi:hypothetical protein
MRKPLIEALVQSQGHCCLYAFILKTAGKKLEPIAARYGVSAKTLNAHRVKVRAGQLRCPLKANCQRELME